MRLFKAVFIGAVVTAGICAIPILIGFIVALFFPVCIFLVIAALAYHGMNDPPESQDDSPKKPP